MAKDVTNPYGSSATNASPGQLETGRFSVLSKSETPSWDPETREFSVAAPSRPTSRCREAFRDLPAETRVQDSPCVTGWSEFDCEFTGVTFPTLAEMAGANEDAVRVMFHALDGYATNLPLAACERRNCCSPPSTTATRSRGTTAVPLRAVTPHRYPTRARSESTASSSSPNPDGDTGRSGISNTPNPWDEERYS